jgi:hypothetical protein
VIHAALAAALVFTPLATYPMNETHGTVAHDTSGHHYNGTIGTDVTLNGRYYAFPFGSHFSYHPHHIVRIDYPDALNPGWRTYRITWRFRIDGKIKGEFSPNYVQKGQGSPEGGMYKLRATSGRVICLFRGSAGDATAATPRGLDFRDGKWHTASCTRYNGAHPRVAVRVDGRTYQITRKPTGLIANTWPVAIAGNSDCIPNTVTKHCNYFRGDIDYMRFSVGQLP